MPKLIVVGRNGTEKVIDGRVGLSMMEIIRDNGFDELQALCGGFCSCATCHVYIEGGPVDRLPPLTGDEDDLLDGSESRSPNSRLACQIKFSSDLDGLRVAIALED